MMDVGHQEVAATCLHLRKCANLNCWEEQAELISCTHVEGGSLGFCKTCSHSEHVLKETTTILHHVSEVGGAWTDGERCSMRRRTRSSILLLWITPDTDHPPTHPVGEARTPFFFFLTFTMSEDFDYFFLRLYLGAFLMHQLHIMIHPWGEMWWPLLCSQGDHERCLEPLPFSWAHIICSCNCHTVDWPTAARLNDGRCLCCSLAGTMQHYAAWAAAQSK